MSADPALIAWMVAADRESCVRMDLLTIRPRGGAPLRWTSGDDRLALPDGRVFVPGPAIERDNVSLRAGLQVSEMNLQLSVDDDVMIGSLTAVQFAERGGLDGAQVTLEWAYFDEDAVFKGNFVRFSGMTGTASWSAGSIEIMARSLTGTLNVVVPREVYQPQCLNQVFDSRCGLRESTWRVTGAVTGVGAGRAALMAIGTGLAQADGWFDLGLLEFTGGGLDGIARTVKRHAGGVIAFALPLPLAPVVGQTFVVRPGCNRSVSTCTNKFNNRVAFRATPFVPPPETVT